MPCSGFFIIKYVPVRCAQVRNMNIVSAVSCSFYRQFFFFSLFQTLEKPFVVSLSLLAGIASEYSSPFSKQILDHVFSASPPILTVKMLF